MERTLTLTPNQIALLLDMVRDDYDRQGFDDQDDMSEGDADLQEEYLEIIRKLKAR